MAGIILVGCIGTLTALSVALLWAAGHDEH